MLYIVSTPIGNLKDITLRALDVLKDVDLIAAEDTRHTGKLLKAYDIHTPMTSFFEHNKTQKAQKILQDLQSGKSVAVVTDAGTPGISDPGYTLINLAKNNNVDISVIPGATASIAALSFSGLPSDRFVFEGFLPVKTTARKKRLEFFKGEERTIIFYESVHRIVKCLEDIDEVFSDPQVCVVREITKKFEECLKDSASQLVAHFKKTKPKGEFVVLLNLKKK